MTIQELHEKHDEIRSNYFKVLILDYMPDGAAMNEELLEAYCQCMTEAYLSDFTNVPLWCLAQAVMEVEDPSDKYKVIDRAIDIIR